MSSESLQLRKMGYHCVVECTKVEHGCCFAGAGVKSDSDFQRLYRAWLALSSPAAFDSRLNTNSGIPSGKHLENLVHDGTRMMVKSSNRR